MQCSLSFFVGSQTHTANMYSINCVPLSTVISLHGKKTVNQLYNYSTVLGAAIKCKPCSEITVEIVTHLKTVKITLNRFAVQY